MLLLFVIFAHFETFSSLMKLVLLYVWRHVKVISLDVTLVFIGSASANTQWNKLLLSSYFMQMQRKTTWRMSQSCWIDDVFLFH